jgi:hypothetical protein
LSSKADRVWELKYRIREAQRRLSLIEEKLSSVDNEEAGRWREIYPKVLEKMESLCSELQELVGWDNTCPWGCYACLNWEKTPLEVFEEQGYLLLWSEVLQDKIAFAKEWAEDRVPQGYVIYLERELKRLFSKGKCWDPHYLRLIHQAKKAGGIIVEVERKA